MNETYRKIGRSVRLIVLPDGSETLIHSEEGGIAEVAGRRFTCRTETPGETPALEIDPASILEAAARIRSGLTEKVEIERLTISHGSTVHSVSGSDTPRIWKEQSVRAIVSLVNRTAGVRCMVQTGGGPRISDLHLDEIDGVIHSLARFTRREVFSGAETIRLSPRVAASLWPFLVHGEGRNETDLSIQQDTHPDFPLDGAGHEITPFEITSRAEWPNVYRPSYRRPSHPAAFHLRARMTNQGSGVRDQRSVDGYATGALSAPHREGNILTIDLLLNRSEDGPGFGRVVSMPVREWIQSIRSVDEHAIWYPFEAGSYGCETEIELSGAPRPVSFRLTDKKKDG